MPFTCGRHRAFAYERGGEVEIDELTPLVAVRWQRVRDEVSTAEVVIPTTECCELLGDLRTIINELHIQRNGATVWEGPITRIEYEQDVVRVFAEDVLWQTKRKVLETGYDQSYPNIGNVIDRVDWLLRSQCYELDGDPWNVLPHLFPVRHDGEPRSSRVMNAYQMYVWEDLDKYAEDGGIDYTVVGRDIYYFDTHLAWKILEPLDEAFLSQFPRIVEYGMQGASRAFVTNGRGYAGSAAVTNEPNPYGIVDLLISNTSDTPNTAAPTAEEIAAWSDTARNNLDERYPPPLAVVIPANTTLLPGSPWEINDLVPGAWFETTVTRMCREVSEYQRLQEVVVTEEAPRGETVQFTAVSAPSEMITP